MQYGANGACLVPGDLNVSTVITGASRVAQFHENLKALEIASRLTQQVMEQVETILANKPKTDEED